MSKKSFETSLQKLFGLIGCVVLIGAATHVRAQGVNLADGDPPLTSQMTSRYVRLMEWSLDVSFDARDRQSVEKQLTEYWQTGDGKNIKGVLDALAFEKSLGGASAAKKGELQPQIKRKLLETMANEPGDTLNALLLGVYRKNQNADVSGAEDGASGGAAGVSPLVGRWQVLHGNSIIGVDANSGKIGDGNAMIAEFDIRADGQVIYSFVLQQSNYGCTTRIKTSKTGRATISGISGSRVTFSYDGGTTKSEDNCNAKNNYAKKLAAEEESLDFRHKRENGKRQLCFANAKLKDCAVKVE